MTLHSFAQKTKVYLTDMIEKVTFSNIKDRLISNESTIAPVHIAKTGTYKGYRDGEFELTSDMFDQMVNNFNSEQSPTPIYRGHADAVGSINGEEPPNSGWVLSLKNDGENLWALVEFTQELANQIKDGMYKFSSIYMRMNDIHRQTGEDIGCRLASLAITSTPFIDGLKPIQLSQNSNSINNYIYEKDSKELKMNKSNKKTNKVVLAQADVMQPAETMNDLQENKTMEIDPMSMIEQIKGQMAPEMPIEDFVKHLLDLFQAEVQEDQAETAEEDATQIAEEATFADKNPQEVKQEQSTEASKDSTPVEDKKIPEEEVAAAIESGADHVCAACGKQKAMSVAASNSVALSETIKSLNLSLSNANKQIESLKQEISKKDEVMLTAVVNDAISKGKLADHEKVSFIKLGQVDRNLFNEMLEARGHKPALVLSRLIPTSETEVESKKPITKQLSRIEEEILKGAGLKK